MGLNGVAGRSLLLVGLMAAAAQAQQEAQAVREDALHQERASLTSNVPSRSGEASTMTNGVPNMLASNPHPGELGIESRLTVRKASHAGAWEGLAVMGAAPAVPPPAARPIRD